MHDIDPNDIDPDTGRLYPGYSSPSLDTSFHDNEMDVDDDGVPCLDKAGHVWVVSDDDEEHVYCEKCSCREY